MHSVIGLFMDASLEAQALNTDSVLSSSTQYHIFIRYAVFQGILKCTTVQEFTSQVDRCDWNLLARNVLIVLLLNEIITLIEMFTLTMAMLCILTTRDWYIDLSAFVNILLDGVCLSNGSSFDWPFAL